ncbi:hypothetical protein AB6735_18740 [Mucilaginibacter sp. RCC_168]|uniref:hypothetical protein n=1 Tax=Mucilaginibacter sp. RCC_168 TaxID=3239221 RepID=UPI0035257596
MNIESQAAATLLDKGIKVRVTAPLLFRLFGRQDINLVIRAATGGTINRCNDLFLSTGMTREQLPDLEDMEAHTLYKQFTPTLCKIIATAWLNSFFFGWLLARIVGHWLYWHMSMPQIVTSMKVILMLMVKEGFLNTIRSAATMQMTAPNLSQINQGS